MFAAADSSFVLVIGAAALIVGYLFGSIPFGLLLTKIAGLGDVRSIGSGNIGATNVLRTGHKGIAALTLLFDVLKGTVPVLLFSAETGSVGALAAGLGAFLGHLFPVWLGFKGGKGVATYIGVLIGLNWMVALAFCGIWLAVAVITRYSSLAALIASLTTPIIQLVVGNWWLALFFGVLTAMLWFKHRENIARLIAGMESRIGAKK